MRIASAESLTRLQKEYQKDAARFPRKILVCLGPGCLAAGSDRIYDAVLDHIARKNIKDVTVEAIKKTGCHGLCTQGPLVTIEP
ncbi:MAG: (2Fe-2S) ferredoxin domain-containing protein, partial [Candidatus Zixiibacteriota bacterium]